MSSSFFFFVWFASCFLQLQTHDDLLFRNFEFEVSLCFGFCGVAYFDFHVCGQSCLVRRLSIHSIFRFFKKKIIIHLSVFCDRSFS